MKNKYKIANMERQLNIRIIFSWNLNFFSLSREREEKLKYKGNMVLTKYVRRHKCNECNTFSSKKERKKERRKKEKRKKECKMIKKEKVLKERKRGK